MRFIVSMVVISRIVWFINVSGPVQCDTHGGVMIIVTVARELGEPTYRFAPPERSLKV